VGVEGSYAITDPTSNIDIRLQGAQSPWSLRIFTWSLNFQIQIHGFLSPYLKKKFLAPELFLVLSTPVLLLYTLPFKLLCVNNFLYLPLV
jgi:hypothetical protein